MNNPYLQLDWARTLKRLWKLTKSMGLAMVLLACIALMLLAGVKIGIAVFSYYGLWILFLWAINVTLYQIGLHRKSMNLLALQVLFLLVVIVIPFI